MASPNQLSSVNEASCGIMLTFVAVKEGLPTAKVTNSELAKEKGVDTVLFYATHLWEMSSNLLVCNICQLGIEDISLLAACHNLVKVDARGNQIQTLPDSSMWQSLRQLKVLYLHDNQIKALPDVCSLSPLTSLSILTLYGNPVTKDAQYRVTAVSSLPSLIALDYHIVGDERTHNSQHKPTVGQVVVQICAPPQESLSKELEVIDSLILEVNGIAAQLSAAQIIQRHWRQWLARNKPMEQQALLSIPELDPATSRLLDTMPSVQTDALSQSRMLSTLPRISKPHLQTTATSAALQPDTTTASILHRRRAVEHPVQRSPYDQYAAMSIALGNCGPINMEVPQVRLQDNTKNQSKRGLIQKNRQHRSDQELGSVEMAWLQVQPALPVSDNRRAQQSGMADAPAGMTNTDELTASGGRQSHAANAHMAEAVQYDAVRIALPSAAPGGSSMESDHAGLRAVGTKIDSGTSLVMPTRGGIVSDHHYTMALQDEERDLLQTSALEYARERVGQINLYRETDGTRRHRSLASVKAVKDIKRYTRCTSPSRKHVSLLGGGGGGNSSSSMGDGCAVWHASFRKSRLEYSQEADDAALNKFKADHKGKLSAARQLKEKDDGDKKNMKKLTQSTASCAARINSVTHGFERNFACQMSSIIRATRKSNLYTKRQRELLADAERIRNDQVKTAIMKKAVKRRKEFDDELRQVKLRMEKDYLKAIRQAELQDELLSAQENVTDMKHQERERAERIANIMPCQGRQGERLDPPKAVVSGTYPAQGRVLDSDSAAAFPTRGVYINKLAVAATSPENYCECPPKERDVKKVDT